MPMRKWIAGWFVVAAVLTGCTSVPTTMTQKPQTTLLWSERVQVLLNLESWDLNALIAIRNQAKTSGDSATLHWSQKHHSYTVSLFGPLGTNGITLKGSKGHVLLEKADGSYFTAPSPEALLAKQTGWYLPVSSLFYWVKGMAVPDVPSTVQLDAQHRLVELVQQGWTVHYLNYLSVKQIDLPTQILLDNSAFSIKIIIKQWQI